MATFYKSKYSGKEIDEKLDKITDIVSVGYGINSLILKDGENQAISENSVALGNKNLSGLKGYYWKCIDFENKKIYLTITQPLTLDTLIDANTITNDNIETNITCEYVVGDIITFVNASKYYDCSKITSIENGIVTVDSLPFTVYADPEGTSFDDFSICCLNKPTIGLCDLGKYSVAHGYDNQALFFGAYSEGAGNKSLGHFAHTEGELNVAYYSAHAEGWANIAKGMNSHAEGKETQANGDRSHSEGYKTIANGNYSHAEGQKNVADGGSSHVEGSNNSTIGANSHAEGSNTITYGTSSHAEGYQTIAGNSVTNEDGTITYGGNFSHAEGQKTSSLGIASHSEGRNTTANGDYSHAEGYQVTTTNQAEHAEGKFNVSNSGSTIHSVGVGTSNSKRKNAHEITTNGKHYILGIGGYNGTKLDGATDVVSYLTSLENRIKELEEKLK
jgi:hypothetical protein